MKRNLSLTVNGEPKDLYVETHASLLDVLRNHLGLMGTHRGCDSGDCGACTVLLQGQPAAACLALAAQYDGATVLTVEGLSQPDRLHPVQQRLIEYGGVQCGFCTPGMVMSAVALLQDNPTATEKEVRAALAGNLCRCTGYAKIVQAVLSLTENVA